jgi:hypothetical protein
MCAAELLAGAGMLLRREAFRLEQIPKEHFVHERALAGAGDAGDAGEHAEREIDIDVAEVVLVGALDLDPGTWRAPFRRNGNGFLAREVSAGERPRDAGDVLELAFENELAAKFAAARSDLDEVIRARITASSCSTTSSVLPLSRRFCITRMRRPTSRGCRPMLGSSRTKRVFTSDAPRQVVRFTRSTSPPLSVRVGRSRLR